MWVVGSDSRFVNLPSCDVNDALIFGGSESTLHEREREREQYCRRAGLAEI